MGDFDVSRSALSLFLSDAFGALTGGPMSCSRCPFFFFSPLPFKQPESATRRLEVTWGGERLPWLIMLMTRLCGATDSALDF